MLKGRLEGIGWFTYENLIRITRNNPQHQFYFVFDRSYSTDFIFSENVTPLIINPPARHPFLYVIWFEFSLYRLINKIKPDVFYSPDGYSSLRTKVPTLLTVHDINFEHSPKDFPLIAYLYLKYFIPKFVHKAKYLSTVSEFSKKDLVEKYNVPGEKIKVIYNGVGSHFRPSTEEEKAETKMNYTSSQNYFLFIGALHARKNIINQLRAFDEFKEKTSLPHKYVLVGKKMWWTKEMEETLKAMKYNKEVIFLGHADSAVLCKLYGAAEALTFVSRLEGFGIPIVEAFACGTAVITSTTSSMPEVAGDAALLSNPDNVQEIALQMEKIATDVELRNSLIEKGLQRAKEFNWDKSAVELENLLIQTAQKKKDE